MKRSANPTGVLLLTLSVLSACGCNAAGTGASVAGGDPALGEIAIRHYGCGACHTIPGIPGATGIVGPPLAKMAERGYLGGILANTPDNMIRWLLDPPAVDPSTAMPNIGLSETDARHIAAYLYTLK